MAESPWYNGGVRSSSVHVPFRKLGEKQPCSPGRKTCQMMTDACRNLPVSSCPRASHQKSKTNPKPGTETVRPQRSKSPVNQVRHSERLEMMFSSEQWLPLHKAVYVYASSGTYNRPGLAVLKVNVCVVGGFPLNLVLLTRTRISITIDQPVALLANLPCTPASLSCIAAKCFRTCLSTTSSHGASIGTRNC